MRCDTKLPFNIEEVEKLSYKDQCETIIAAYENSVNLEIKTGDRMSRLQKLRSNVLDLFAYYPWTFFCYSMWRKRLSYQKRYNNAIHVYRTHRQISDNLLLLLNVGFGLPNNDWRDRLSKICKMKQCY